MKNLLEFPRLSPYKHAWLLLLRIGIAATMLTHGIPKLKRLAAGNFEFADPIGLGSESSLILAVFSEVLCSVLLAAGIATRFAATALIVTMLVAALIHHGPDPFARKEMAVLYLFIYFTILVLGPGKYSVDHRIIRNS